MVFTAQKYYLTKCNVTFLTKGDKAVEIPPKFCSMTGSGHCELSIRGKVCYL